MTEIQKTFWLGVVVGYAVGIMAMAMAVILYTTFPNILTE